MSATRYLLYFHAPEAAVDACKAAVFKAGAGRYPEGRYTECCFTLRGDGQFRPGHTANPHIGSVDKLEHTKEAKVEVLCFGADIVTKVVKALKE